MWRQFLYGPGSAVVEALRDLGLAGETTIRRITDLAGTVGRRVSERRGALSGDGEVLLGKVDSHGPAAQL